MKKKKKEKTTKLLPKGSRLIARGTDENGRRLIHYLLPDKKVVEIKV